MKLSEIFFRFLAGFFFLFRVSETLVRVKGSFEVVFKRDSIALP